MIVQRADISSRNQPHMGFVGFGRLECPQGAVQRQRVGRTGVVDVGHAIEFPQPLPARRQGMQLFQGQLHRLNGDLQNMPHQHGGHHVFSMMLSLQWTFCHIEQRSRPTIDAADQKPTVHEHIGAAILRRKTDHLTRNTDSQTLESG